MMMNLGRILPAANRGVQRRYFSALVSALDEYPGIPAVFPQPSKASVSSVSTLPNGLTVVTETSASTTTVTLTFPGAGSGSESLEEAGAALVNKSLAFKSGSGLSSALIIRNFDDDGAVPFSTADRMSATVGFTCAPDKALRLIPLIATSCTFEKWDVRDAIATAQMEVQDASENAQVALTEQMFAAAYGSETPMGRPFYSAGATSATARSFRAKAYGIRGAVLAATGVSDHGAFCRALEERLAEAEVGTGAATPSAASYLAGEVRTHVPSMAIAHVALVFKAPTGSVVSQVLKECLSLQGTSAFAFSAGGLIGTYGSDVDAMCSALTTKPSAQIIQRAKQLAKAKAVFSYESGSQALARSMTSQVLETGSFDAAGAAYDKITDAEVTKAYDAMVSSGLSLAAIGNLTHVPYKGTLASRFSS